jgi:hypothetical protein
MGKMPINRNSGAVKPTVIVRNSQTVSAPGSRAGAGDYLVKRSIYIDSQALTATRKETKADVQAAKIAAGKRVTKSGTTGNKNKAKTAVNTPQVTSTNASSEELLDTTGYDTTSGLAPVVPPGGGQIGPGTGIGLYGYRWNLPPHKWSLPVEPSDDSFTVNTEAFTLGSSPKYRRGRIYWYSRVDSTYVDTSTYNTGSGVHAKDPRYGFQFLWNPESFSTSVSVNMDITPSFADKFVDVVGAFPSGEYLTVSLRLDRTNDFASIKSLPRGTAPDGNDVYARYAQSYSQYYAGAEGFNSQGFDSFTQSAGNLGQNVGEKILELQKYGTIADLEYLYKAINGPGWSNSATGKATSDIGFLMPTLLRIDIGPLSYLGYVNNLQVNHTAFSKGMVPIRTDVSLQFNLMATAGLSSR